MWERVLLEALARLVLPVSILVVAALAVRPKLSLAVVATLPAAMAVWQNTARTPLPDWLLICGIVASAYALCAVVVALLFRWSGRYAAPFGELPSGREVRYSSADRAGLWYTFALLVFMTAVCVIAALEPPYETFVVRLIAIGLAPMFAAFAVLFWLVLRDAHIVIRLRDDGLEVDSAFYPWSELAGHTLWFGVFRVYDKSGRRVLRVDNIIDGFPALLYHVNRKTMPRYADHFRS